MQTEHKQKHTHTHQKEKKIIYMYKEKVLFFKTRYVVIAMNNCWPIRNLEFLQIIEMIQMYVLCKYSL